MLCMYVCMYVIIVCMYVMYVMYECNVCMSCNVWNVCYVRYCSVMYVVCGLVWFGFVCGLV